MAKIKLDELQKEPSLIQLGRAIESQRKKAGLSQLRLGLLSGTTQSYICDLEAGRRNPSYLILIRIANSLGCEVSYLCQLAESFSSRDRAM